jgi:SAM-dependent methyltransferase
MPDDTDETLRTEERAAESYETLFVPALFAEWASRVADAAQIQPGQHVLDVACGTGVLARAARARTGPSGSVAGLDASRGMLTVAARLAPDIDWRHGSADALPFADSSFDAVVSQFGLMFFKERGQALREMLRVLKSQGCLAVAVWSAIEELPAYAVELKIFERLAGPRAAEALRAPFALGDRALLASLFTEAGMPSARIETQHGTARFPSIRTMVEADLRGWLPMFGVTLSEREMEEILQDADRLLSPYATLDGAVAFDAPAHLVTARKP